MKIKAKKYWVLGVLSIIALVGIMKAANIVSLTNLNSLMLDGSLYFGNAQEPNSVILNAKTSADLWSIKVPFYNASGVTIAKGSIITSVSNAQNYAYGTVTTAVATTTVLGVSDGLYSAGTTGYMVIAGYCTILTTGTIHIGDILVSTMTAGYSAPSTGTQVVGSGVAKALSATTVTAGDSVVALVGAGY
jgi:hypothetical protein